jgi:hypothetical protein
MLRGLALVAIALLPLATWAADSGGYRLAGIIAAGPDYLAILELPGGQQQVVRAGSSIEGGARVVAVDARNLRLQIPGRTLDLALDGSGAAPFVPPGLGVVQVQSDVDNVMVRRVDTEAFSNSVARSTAAPAPPAAGTAPPPRTDPATEAGRRLAPVLNLPPDSRITAVNEQPVRSAEQAIRLLEDSLQAGVSPRLDVQSAGGPARVYLSPERDDAPPLP